MSTLPPAVHASPTRPQLTLELMDRQQAAKRPEPPRAPHSRVHDQEQRRLVSPLCVPSTVPSSMEMNCPGRGCKY